MRKNLGIAVFSLAFWVASHSLGVGQETVAEIFETKLPTYTAEIVKLNREGLTIKLSGQSRLLLADQLLRVRLPEPSEPATKGKLLVELNDGSQIYCRQAVSDGRDVQLQMVDGSALSLPARQIASCLLQPLQPDAAKQWEAIVESKITSDMLILQRSPESLDKIEGVIGQITDTAVKFQFDGQEIDVQRTKLAGWRYFAANEPSKAKLLAVVRDTAGSNWMTSEVTTNWTTEAAAELTLTGGIKISLPPATLSEIDFSFGSMRFLADIEPLERKVQPRLSLAIKIPEAEQLFGPRPSAAESSRGLAAGPGIQFMGSGSITYRVPSDFKRLLGSVALDPDGPQYVACKAQVFIEDKVVWERTLDQPHQPQKIDLEVDPGRRLRLVVQADSKQPIGDLVNWRQLRFVK